MAGQVKLLTVFPAKGGEPGERECSRKFAVLIADKMLRHRPDFFTRIDSIGNIASSKAHMYAIVRAYVFSGSDRNFMLKLVDEGRQPVIVRAYSGGEEAGIVLNAVEEKAGELTRAREEEPGAGRILVYKGKLRPCAAEFEQKLGEFANERKMGEIMSLLDAGARLVLVEVGLPPNGVLDAKDGGLPNLAANAIVQAAISILGSLPNTLKTEAMQLISRA
ncbi:MAG: hypothetical protein WC717_03425 [Candidatus Micrarchaeia archaeon]|jgi:hypothetical protein